MCLKVVKSYRYLGHWISEDLSDDIDIYIYINIKQLYKQSYEISYNFNHCSKDTTMILFKTFFLIYTLYTIVAFGYQIDIAWLNLI